MSLIDSALLVHPRQNELYSRLGSAGDRPVCFTAAISPYECVEPPRITRSIQCVVEDVEGFKRCCDRSVDLFERWATLLKTTSETFRVWRGRMEECHSSIVDRHDDGHPHERYVTLKADADCVECWEYDKTFTRQLIEIHTLTARALSAAEDARCFVHFIEYPRYANGEKPGMEIPQKEGAEADSMQSVRAVASPPPEHAESASANKSRGKGEARK